MSSRLQWGWGVGWGGGGGGGCLEDGSWMKHCSYTFIFIGIYVDMF